MSALGCPCGCSAVPGVNEDLSCARWLGSDPAAAYRRRVHLERHESGRYSGAGWAGGRYWPRPDGMPTVAEVLHKVADARAAEAEEHRAAGDLRRWELYALLALALRGVAGAFAETAWELAG